MRLATTTPRVAFGIEGRRESLEQTNSDALVTGDIIAYGGAFPSLPEARRTVWSIFAEVNIPIMKSVQADVALRYDHYSDFGSTTNPKFTLRWQPSRELLLRGSFGTGFRAPTLSDLFLPLSSSGGNVTGGYDDPIRCPVTHSDYDCPNSNGGDGFPIRNGGEPQRIEVVHLEIAAYRPSGRRRFARNATRGHPMRHRKMHAIVIGQVFQPLGCPTFRQVIGRAAHHGR